MQMDFGTYRGKDVSEVPSSYLRWAVENCMNIKPPLRATILNYLTGAVRQTPRAQPGPVASITKAEASRKIAEWYRLLALKYHPDRGGRNESLAIINAAADMPNSGAKDAQIAPIRRAFTRTRADDGANVAPQVLEITVRLHLTIGGEA